MITSGNSRHCISCFMWPKLHGDQASWMGKQSITWLREPWMLPQRVAQPISWYAREATIGILQSAG